MVLFFKRLQCRPVDFFGPCYGKLLAYAAFMQETYFMDVFDSKLRFLRTQTGFIPWKKPLLWSVLVALSSALFVVSPSAARPSEMPAKIIHVDDGDTVVALTSTRMQLRVRLASIDAPEIGHGHCRPGQPWSQQAKRRLASLVLGKDLQLRCYDVDPYGRDVCDLQLGDTTASRILADEGLAWANRANPRFIRDRNIPSAEAAARSGRAGLWADPNATAPWIWRKTEWLAPQPGCTRRNSP